MDSKSGKFPIFSQFNMCVCVCFGMSSLISAHLYTHTGILIIFVRACQTGKDGTYHRILLARFRSTTHTHSRNSDFVDFFHADYACIHTRFSFHCPPPYPIALLPSKICFVFEFCSKAEFIK